MSILNAPPKHCSQFNSPLGFTTGLHTEDPLRNENHWRLGPGYDPAVGSITHGQRRRTVGDNASFNLNIWQRYWHIRCVGISATDSVDSVFVVPQFAHSAAHSVRHIRHSVQCNGSDSVAVYAGYCCFRSGVLRYDVAERDSSSIRTIVSVTVSISRKRSIYRHRFV